MVHATKKADLLQLVHQKLQNRCGEGSHLVTRCLAAKTNFLLDSNTQTLSLQNTRTHLDGAALAAAQLGRLLLGHQQRQLLACPAR